MAIDQAIADVLDETIKALSLLDLNRLEALEKRIAGLARFRLVADEARVHSIQAKKYALERVLHNSASNLNALNRLYRRDARDPWEH